MITIIRYRNDTYYGLEGEVEQPSRRHSGHTSEDIRLEKLHNGQMEEFERKKGNASYLNKVHAKKALDTELPNWKEKYQNELKDIQYKLNHVHGFSDFGQLWKREYTFYNLNNSSIEDLTKPTN